MNAVTLHADHAELAPLIRTLVDLAGGDRTAVRSTTGGAIVDDSLAYTYLAARLNGASLSSPDPASRLASPLLETYVSGIEETANLGPAAPDPLDEPAPPRRTRPARKSTTTPAEDTHGHAAH